MKKFLSPHVALFVVIVVLVGGLAISFNQINLNSLKGQSIDPARMYGFDDQMVSLVEKKAETKTSQIDLEELIDRFSPLCLEQLEDLQNIHQEMIKWLEVEKILIEEIKKEPQDAVKIFSLEEQSNQMMNKVQKLISQIRECPEQEKDSALFRALDFLDPACEEQESIAYMIRELVKKLEERSAKQQLIQGNLDQALTIKNPSNFEKGAIQSYRDELVQIEKTISSLLRDIQEKLREFSMVDCGEKEKSDATIDLSNEPLDEVIKPFVEGANESVITKPLSEEEVKGMEKTAETSKDPYAEDPEENN